MRTLGISVFVLFLALADANAAITYNVTDLGMHFGQGATGINNAGQVVGSSSFGTSGFAHACIFSGGSLLDLGTLGGAQHCPGNQRSWPSCWERNYGGR